VTGWLDWLRAIAAHEPAAMVSILACEGSAPRGPGTRMVVTAAGLHGTIGGGNLEYRAIEQARAILALPPGSWRVQDYPLGPLLGQCCGGRVRLLVEHVDPAGLGWLDEAVEGALLVSTLGEAGIARQVSPRGTPSTLSARDARPGAGACLREPIGEAALPLFLFGAGHVGQAVARHARGLPIRLAWFDTRAELAAMDGVTTLPVEAIEQCVEGAPEGAAILILTHDHGLDYRLARAALARRSLAYVGLIGSATKKARFLGRLAREGLGQEARARLVCPIGVPGITGKQPDVIAIAALAQLLQLGAAS
jgi:xanthine dehydrogenase accessory factor